MKVLIVGGGGREHALAWKVAQSSQVERVFVAPGNAGTAVEDKVVNVTTIDASDIKALKVFAQQEAVRLTIIGPEALLVQGVVDVFQQDGLACFGPSQAAAILEGSKSFSKDFLLRHNIPTAKYQVFTEVDAAQAYVRQQSFPIVIKADGLAAGKGVVIANSQVEADQAIVAMLADNAFGVAGDRIVIEEFISGEEVSFIAISDGEYILPLASSQDYKARDAGGKGPNTGGMGAYSPVAIVTDRLHQHIMEKIMRPTVQGMAEEGRKYVGFLYAGLMVAADGEPKVLEFNCRLGDPETQPLMMRLQGDLFELCCATLAGSLDQLELSWDPRTAVGVVLASQGYPGVAKQGDVISGLPNELPTGIKIFHAGSKKQGDLVVTAGGRVLCVTGLGNTVAQARGSVYQMLSELSWDGMFCRQDIAGLSSESRVA